MINYIAAFAALFVIALFVVWINLIRRPPAPLTEEEKREREQWMQAW